jgi:hypothetical protein
MPPDPETPDHGVTLNEIEELAALNGTYDVLADILGDPETATPAAIRMGTACMRRAADLLDQIADRWDTDAA